MSNSVHFSSPRLVKLHSVQYDSSRVPNVLSCDIYGGNYELPNKHIQLNSPPPPQCRDPCKVEQRKRVTGSQFISMEIATTALQLPV